jgi:hypothetical protein
MHFNGTNRRDWAAYLNYIPEYRLTDVKGMWECIEQLQTDERVSAFSSQQIESGFQRFWSDDERPEYVTIPKNLQLKPPMK